MPETIIEPASLVPGTVVPSGAKIAPSGPPGPPGTAPPIASSSQSGLLQQLSGNTTDFVDGTNACQNLANAVQPTVWASRIRAYNSVQNSGFEVDQRQIHGSLTNPASGAFICDRWSYQKTGTMTVNLQSVNQSAPINIPGTSFGITGSALTVTLTAQEASLGASDFLMLQHVVEGPRLRPLVNDVHSFSILAQTSVAAGLKFGLSLVDGGLTRSLVLLCTIPAPNVWTLIQLPNLAIFPASIFDPVTGPGVIGYTIRVCLAGGSTYVTPSNGFWQAGNYIAAQGQDSFAAAPVNSTFQLAFLQHEPGPLCGQLIHQPFNEAYDEALRYFQKTWDYGTAVGTANVLGIRNHYQNVAAASAYTTGGFSKPMAKAPTVTLYDHNNGAVNSVMDSGSVHHTGAAASSPSTTGFYQITFTTATTAVMTVWAHYTADSLW